MGVEETNDSAEVNGDSKGRCQLSDNESTIDGHRIGQRIEEHVLIGQWTTEVSSKAVGQEEAAQWIIIQFLADVVGSSPED